MQKLIASAIATAIALGSLSGCALFKEPDIPEQKQYETTLKEGANTHAAFARAVEEGNAAWARRAESPAHIRTAIAAWKRADAVDPFDRGVLQHLALASYYIANYYTEPDGKPAAHEEGYAFGVRAARLNPEIRRAMDGGPGVEKMPIEEAVKAHATPGDVPALYWMTVNRGRQFEDAAIAKRAAMAPVLKTIMEKIYKIGPEYYWGGVHRFFGVYYIKAPAQSDPLAQSQREFQRAIAIGPQNLENKVLFAEYAAKANNDRALYEKLLKEVIATKAEADVPALRLDNAEARKRAQKMLETIDEDFGKLALAAAAAVGFAALLPGAPADADDKTIQLKFGTLAPDNTPWSDILKNFKKDVQKETKGKVRVQLYLNGVLGDEAVMLQKMKFGQLTGGGFSTGGISTVVPELQVFELPFLFNNDEEADHVMDNVVLDDVRKACEARGLFLYMWAVNGWHDIGHKSKPIKTLADCKGEKAHAQETDIQKALWASLNANATPLAVPEVLNALQRGMIDCYSTTPIFASAAQWFTQTKHWTDSNHIYQPAAVVFDKKWWDSIDADLQKTIMSFAPKLQASARKDVRGIDADLFEEFKKTGITIHTLTPEAREEFKKATAGVGDELVAKGVFTKELLDKVRKGLAEYRATKAAPKQ